MSVFEAYEGSSRSYARPIPRRTASSTSSNPSSSSSSDQHIPVYPDSVSEQQLAIGNTENQASASFTDENPNVNMHTLRSSFQYQHLEDHNPHLVALYQAFNDVYIPFRDGRPIPKRARETLSKYTLTSQEYYALVTDRELPSGRYIYLDDGKIIFDEWTMPPHAEVIVEVVEQIAAQNRLTKLFQGGSGGSLSNCT